ncbi:hypothetical protein ACLOJK_026569 [Asimina triloba]
MVLDEGGLLPVVLGLIILWCLGGSYLGRSKGAQVGRGVELLGGCPNLDRWVAGEDVEVEASEDRGPVPQCRAEPVEAEAFAHRGVLRATLGEISSRGVDDEIFRRPFDVEARALKILGDLLPIQSRSLRENHALGQVAPLDREGQRLAKLLLLEFLPDVWRKLMELKERIRLINGVAQVTRKVLRPNASFPSIWEHLEGLLASVVSEAHRIVKEELGIELE